MGARWGRHGSGASLPAELESEEGASVRGRRRPERAGVDRVLGELGRGGPAGPGFLIFLLCLFFPF